MTNESDAAKAAINPVSRSEAPCTEPEARHHVLKGVRDRHALVLAVASLLVACAPSQPAQPPLVAAVVNQVVGESLGAHRYFRIRFEPGSALFTLDGRPEADQAAYMSTRLPVRSFELWGHGDPGQPKRGADRLAMRRMRAVKNAIESHTILTPAQIAEDVRRWGPSAAEPPPPVRIHSLNEASPPEGIEGNRSPVDSSVEIYCSDGTLPWITDATSRTSRHGEGQDTR